MPKRKRNNIPKKERCLSCGKKFMTATSVLQHMNQPTNACGSWLDDLAHISDALGSDAGSSPGPSPSRSPSPQTHIPMDDYEQDYSSIFEGSDASVLPEDPPHFSDEAGMTTDYYEGAGEALEGGELFMDTFHEDEHAEKRKTNIFYPFASKQDWELASWLLCSGLSMTAIDSFLSLALIILLPLSFRSARQLRLRAEMLPSGPQWKYKTISTAIATKHPARLFYRDVLECTQALLSHPLFEQHISFIPRKVWMNSEQSMRRYDDWLSGNSAWEMQDQLIPGATLLGIVLSSDKTNISVMTGNHMAHPLLLSLANIDSSIRSKSMLHVYALLALLPVAKFVHKNSRVRSLLQDRLVHECLTFVLNPLKTATSVGTMMSDGAGHLSDIELLCSRADLDDYENFIKAARALHLNGVTLPFWKGWEMSCPSTFLTPKVLHHLHRMFWDHDTKWCVSVVGDDELDFCFSVLQTNIGYCSFIEGISKLKQVTGHNHRSIQQYIVGIIAGAVPPKFLRAICAFTDFCYLSQAPHFDDKTLVRLEAALKEFHDNKHAITQAEGRMGKRGPINDWAIPKLELLQSIVLSIRASGAIMQWTADVTEHVHVTEIKDPAQSGNNRDYYSQIARHLDRAEKCFHFNIATCLDVDTAALDNDRSEYEHEPDPEKTRLAEFSSPGCPIVNYFTITESLNASPTAPQPSRTFATKTTAFHLAVKPSLRMTVDEAAEAFGLPDLRPAISDFLFQASNQLPHNISGWRRALPGCHLPFTKIQIWCKIRVQLPAYHDRSSVEPPQTLRICPPSNELPQGLYDSVIMNTSPESHWPVNGLEGFVVQLRLVFRPLNSSHYLAYVQTFNIVPHASGGKVNPGTNMHSLKRAVWSNGEHIGGIIPITQVRSPTHLIPRFGKQAHPCLTRNNSSEVSSDFWLNKYWNKDFYHALSDLAI
ncbi:hypothetical protein BV22DRAFT_1026118 [Leucogyrophana mollusca]|uniref:Uncharacterized protein n=1 Tax=Leucogyrophana mollusca TaxID=85980 RepID=A0ACB8AWF2_9AGAM|nr:hypothetical protein BV22DRAFT_1026118 [Leucogyrophana mollusca]